MPHFVIFKDEQGEWRWKLVARNGRIVAVSGEGFKNKAHALKTINVATLLVAKVNKVYVEE